MTKKNILLLAVAFLAVAFAYWQLYKDSFRPRSIHISHTVRYRLSSPGRPTPKLLDAESGSTVNFGLGGEYRLTEVKVTSEAELATNKFAHPVWHLISDSNSTPVRVVVYGQGIRGMHPAVKGAQPDPLADGIPYKMSIDAGNLHGEHNFTVGAGQPPIKAQPTPAEPAK